MACLRRFWGLSYVWASLPATPFVGPPGAFLGAKKAPTAADAVFLKITATSRPCSGAVPPQTRLKSGLFHTCPRQSRPFPHFSDMLSPYNNLYVRPEYRFPAHHIHKGNLQTGKLNVPRHKVYPFLMAEDTFPRLYFLVID